MLYGGESVGDDQDGEILTKLFDRTHHRLFGRIIYGTSGFVEHQHAGLFIKGASS